MTAPGVHLIEPGDTYYALARRYGVTVEHLREWNPDVDERNLKVGQALQIAPPVAEPEPTPEPAPPPVDYGPDIVALKDQVAALAARPVPQDYGAQIADLTGQVAALAARPPITGGAVTSSLGAMLDSFKGNTWDDRLAAACTYAAAASATYTPPILFPAGRYDLTRQVKVYDGMKFIHPAAGSFQRAAGSIPVDVRYSGSAPFLQLAASTVFDVQLSGIGFQANAGGVFFDTGPGVVWTSVFRDLGFNGWTNIFGTVARKFLNTACTWDGWLNVNNCLGTPFTLGGSDSEFAWSRALFDVGSLNPAAFAKTGGWLLDFAGQQKARVSGVYITCEAGANGIRVRNSTSDGRLVLDAPIIEGRNAGQPCTGVNLQVDGGTVIVQAPWISYGNRALTDRSGALVVHNGGDLTIVDPHYGRATARKAADPWLHQTGGTLTLVRGKARDGGQIAVKSAGGTRTMDGTYAAA